MNNYYISAKKINSNNQFMPVDFQKNRLVNTVMSNSIYLNKTMDQMIEIVNYLKTIRPGIEFKINKL